ncbi:MAG: YCF48-related protein [Woeseiaceae bacterium]|nr:YCF48-related protein [Woeseiaceae bacterium]
MTTFAGTAPAIAASTEYALLPAIKTDRALEGLLLSVAQNGERILVAGEQGHIFFSDDFGQNWVHADVPVSLAVTSVAFGAGDEAWATAHKGFLLHSSDNGSTWQVHLTGSDVAQLSLGSIQERVDALQKAVDEAEPDAREDLEWVLDDTLFALDEATAAVDEGMTTPLLKVWFSNDNDGFALGAYGVFLRTRDGGNSWVVDGNRLDNPDNFHLYDIVRSNAGTLLVVGEAGTLLRSSDGGETWQRAMTPYEGSYFGAVAASDGSLLIFGLRGNVFRSTDEGETWVAVETGDNRTLTGGTAGPDGSVIIVGAAGAVLQSRESGTSFNAIPTEGNRVYSDVTIAPDGQVIVVGFGGIGLLVGDNR